MKVHHYDYAPELKKDTANHLYHSQKTAEKNNFVTDLQTRAGETSSKIQELLCRKPKAMEKVFEWDVEKGFYQYGHSFQKVQK